MMRFLSDALILPLTHVNHTSLKNLYDQLAKGVKPKAVKLIDSLRTNDKSIAKTSR